MGNKRTAPIVLTFLLFARSTDGFFEKSIPKTSIADPPSVASRTRTGTTSAVAHRNRVRRPSVAATSSTSLAVSLFEPLVMSQDTAEALAGPFFGASLFPYLAFLYFLDVPENETPKGVTVGFATCLLFVFLTIPAAIAAKILYGVSLADSDWLHGSAESLLTVTNLVTVVAFRQALAAEERSAAAAGAGATSLAPPPRSATEYGPMVVLVAVLTAAVFVTALIPALADPLVHTPYLGGFLDLPTELWTSIAAGATTEPENALTVACWTIHVSSLVEFLVAMGFVWRWADVVGNPTWKGLTWGLLPLHSSGITACTYHLFYNRVPVLVPIQALLTCVGNTTAAYAAYRVAKSNGWRVPAEKWGAAGDVLRPLLDGSSSEEEERDAAATKEAVAPRGAGTQLVGFEDLGDALANDNDYTFLVKLFVGCAVASYAIKYGETFFDFPYDADVGTALAVVLVPSLLNAYKWRRRSEDPSFEGWF